MGLLIAHVSIHCGGARATPIKAKGRSNLRCKLSILCGSPASVYEPLLAFKAEEKKLLVEGNLITCESNRIYIYFFFS